MSLNASLPAIPDNDSTFQPPGGGWEDFEEVDELVSTSDGQNPTDLAKLLAYSTLMAKWLEVPKSRIMSFVRTGSCSPEQALALDRHLHWFEWQFNCFACNRKGIIKTAQHIINTYYQEAREEDEEEAQNPPARVFLPPQEEEGIHAVKDILNTLPSRRQQNQEAGEEDDEEGQELSGDDDSKEEEPQSHVEELEKALALASRYNACLARRHSLERRATSSLSVARREELQERWHAEGVEMTRCDEDISTFSDRARQVYGNAKYIAWVQSTIDEDLRKGLPVDQYDVTEIKELLRDKPDLKLDHVADRLPKSWSKAFQIMEMSLSSGHETRNTGLLALTQGMGYMPEPKSNKGWARIFGRRKAPAQNQQQGVGPQNPTE